MKAEFTPTGGSAATLVDDANRLFGQVLDLSAGAVEQVTPLFRAAAPARFMRGNVSGQVVFAAWSSFATVALAAAYLKAELARLNGAGSLVLTFGVTTVTFAGATLRQVAREEWDGVFVRVRYTFGITTIT